MNKEILSNHLPLPLFMNTSQVAEILGVCKLTARRFIKEELNAKKVGRSYVTSSAQLIKYFSNLKKETNELQQTAN